MNLYKNNKNLQAKKLIPLIGIGLAILIVVILALYFVFSNQSDITTTVVVRPDTLVTSINFPKSITKKVTGTSIKYSRNPFSRHTPVLTQIISDDPDSQTHIYLSPNPLVTSRSSGTLDVHIDSNVRELSGVQLELEYDPKVLTDIDLKPGKFSKDGIEVLEKIDATYGRITYAIIFLHEPAKTSKGILATMKFKINSSTQSQTPKQLAASPTLSTSLPTPTPEPTADWKTFSAEKYASEYGSAYNFSLMYPSNWKVREHDYLSGFDMAFLSPDHTSPTTGAIEEVLTGARIELFILPNQKITTLTNWFNTKYTDPQTNSISYKPTQVSLKINNQQTVQGLQYDGKNLEGNHHVELFTIENTIYSFRIQAKENPEIYRPTLTQIISSFKLLHQTADTSNWKTYTNTKYGYAFKHPKDYTVYSKIDYLKKNFIVATPFSEDVTVLANEYLTRDTEPLTIKISVKKEDENLKDWLEKNSYNYVSETQKITMTETTINGKKVTQLEGLGSTSYFIVFSRGNYLILINQLGSIDVLNTIISTFKFTQ